MRAATGSDGGSPRGSHFWGALFLEIFAVFIGITAAFFLDAYRQERSDVRRRAQIVDALVVELQDVSSGGRDELPDFESLLRDFDEQRAAGERPALVSFFPAMGFRGDMWESALQMGGVELLDVDLAMRLSQFYGDVRAQSLVQDQWTQLNRDILIPNLGEGADEFYDSRGTLRPKYQWYPDVLRMMVQNASDILDEADSLVVLLRPYGSLAVTLDASIDTTAGTDTTSADSTP